MRSDRQLIAIGGNGSGLFEPFSGLSDLPPVATSCDRSAPLMLHSLVVEHPTTPDVDQEDRFSPTAA
jgi:hypothetical protein